MANAEGEVPVIAPNTWIEIKGTNLARAAYTRQSSDIVNGQMPTTLKSVSVNVNGKNAFVYYVSPVQIDVLTPPDPLPSSAAVVVTANGTPSTPFNVAANPVSPSFFVYNGGPYVIAQDGPSSIRRLDLSGRRSTCSSAVERISCLPRTCLHPPTRARHPFRSFIRTIPANRRCSAEPYASPTGLPPKERGNYASRLHTILPEFVL